MPERIVATSAKSESEAMVAAEGVAVVEEGAPRFANGTENESINVWPDETAEASFLAEARERGETVVAAKPTGAADTDSEDEASAKILPPLDTLIGRLSPEVRETLDDLFRAKFTAVRRVPKKALKG